MLVQLIRKFSNHTKGNIGINFAIMLLPILTFVGVTIDYSNISRLRAQAMDASDTAVLAAAIALREEGIISAEPQENIYNMAEIEEVMSRESEKYFGANIQLADNFQLEALNTDFDTQTNELSTTITTNYRPFILGLFGRDEIKISVESAVVLSLEAGGAISMFLVLDKSGSMNGSRMNDLKGAVANLAVQIQTADPEAKYVRIGAVAYDSKAKAEQSIEWGPAAANAYVQALNANGGTSSTKAVKKAHQNLVHNREAEAHEEKNGFTEHDKIAVFMTDGNNNYAKDDNKTKKRCDKMKEDDIEIYTVAFQAPLGGQQLLQYCATSANHYFDADNAEELNDAFSMIGAKAVSNLALSR